MQKQTPLNMPTSRIADAIIAEVRPARKIDKLRNIWSDVQKLRQARLTCKQIVEQLPARYGIKDITYNQFNSICYRIRKRPPAADSEAAPKPSHYANSPDFDPIADAKRRLEEQTRPIFQERKER